MNSVLIQEIDKTYRHVYFVGKVFIGAEARYHKIEKLSLVIALVSKLRPYFQGQKMFVKSNYHVHQVLKKPDLKRRMVS